MSTNRVTIFSNGIADFRRNYAVHQGSPTEVSLPVRKDHIGDVLGSLNVYGDVSVTSPPSFRPSNEAEGNLSIDADQVLEGLATRLAGARVVVATGGGETQGKLVGLHAEETFNGLTKTIQKFLIVQTGQGLQRISLGEVQALRFVDEAIQTEIDKALQRNFESIKPNSTFVELSLATQQDEAEAIVQYTVPAAAWKISYRLRQAGDEPFEFQGFAIVDNNTEEDWQDFLVSVVTGEPITFSTDLAESKTPRRKHVDIVRDVALGAVEVEESELALEDVMVAAAAPMGGGAVESSKLRKMSRARGAYEAADQAVSRAPTARTQEVDIQESGDYCLFQAADPVSIGANRSAVIPVFNTTLDKSRVVLHYKHENHAERPYRSIEFTNETSFSLGRGVCTVFRDGHYAGGCILPATRPEGDALLPHALETGVRVRRDKKRVKRKAVGIRIAEGFCYTSHRETQETEYRIFNRHDQPFRFVLDHHHQLHQPDVTCALARAGRGEEPFEVSETLKAGFRARFELGSKEPLTFTVVETRIQESSVRLVQVGAQQDDLNINWIEENIVATNGPLADDPGIRACLEIYGELADKIHAIRDAIEETQRLAERQERLRKNIKTGGLDDQTNRWKADLGTAESKLVELEDTVIPQLRTEEQKVRKELQTAMMSLAVEWDNE